MNKEYKYNLTLFFGRYETRSAGVWMYSVELFNSFCELVQEDKRVKDMLFPMRVVFAGLDEQMQELEKIKMKYADFAIDIVRLKDFKNHRKIGQIRDFFRNFRNTRIIHATANTLPFLSRGIKILTIHDLFQAFPIIKPKGIYQRFRVIIYRLLFFIEFKIADQIVCDLNLINDELLQRYKNLNSVCTILPGLKSVYLNSDLPDKENKSQYIISFASKDPRKNILNVIDAFKNTYFLENISLRIITSSDEIKNNLESYISSNNILNIEVFSQVSDSQMQEIYSDARALVFPSLAEGFGFPIYEALSQGIPVVASSNLTLEDLRVEVRPFVIECNPVSIESISNAMLRAVSLVQRVEKREKVAKSVRNALNFRNTAIEFIEIYSKYLNNAKNL